MREKRVTKIIHCPHSKRAKITRIGGENIHRYYETESRCTKCNWTSNAEVGNIFREASGARRKV